MFVDNLLEKDPKKRMTIKQVLEHPWLQKFQSINQTEIFSKRKNKDLTGGEEFKIYSTSSSKNQ